MLFRSGVSYASSIGLGLKAAAVHSAARRARLNGLDRQQTRLEILSSWFRAQPRSANKVIAPSLFSFIQADAELLLIIASAKDFMLYPAFIY